VTLYWPEEDLGPDARRELGFTYGMGSLAGAEGQGRLALSVGGTFTPGNDLTVAAYVKEPAKGEKLTLELPVGWKLLHGPAVAAVAVPPAAASRHISLVAWKVRSAPGTPASGRVQVRSSAGPSQALTIAIHADRAFE
jgi:hypothetical protein